MKVKNRRVVEISHVFSETFYALRKYNWTNNSDGPAGRQLVFMVDDSGFYTGGLADRFKGAVSAYAWCLCNGIDFKIRYTFPFELSDYLLPAEHDWVLKPNEFSRNLFDTKLMYARGEHGRRLLAMKTSKRQIHYIHAIRGSRPYALYRPIGRTGGNSDDRLFARDISMSGYQSCTGRHLNTGRDINKRPIGKCTAIRP